MTVLSRLREWARELRAQVLTLWFSRAHPDTPLAAKLVAMLVVAYALSPIDLIPDFIPVLGFLDELVVLPLGISLALALIPEHVLVESRQRADRWFAERREQPRSYAAAAVIVLVWAAGAYGIWILVGALRDG